jgi:membrane dipeptidase
VRIAGLRLLVFLLGGLLAPLAARGADVEERPFEVVDLNVGLPYQVVYRERTLARGSGQYLASELSRAGVVGVVLELQFPPRLTVTGLTRSDLDSAHARLLEAIRTSPPYATPGCNAPAGRVKTWLSLQTSEPLARDPGAVPEWVARGVRAFALVYRYDNGLASSSGKRPQSSWGLSEAGREFVRRVHAAGALIDVSHASDRATEEVLDLAAEAGSAVIATHSNARALSPHARNLTDAQLRRIAASGGIVGFTFHRPFLSYAHVPTLDDAVRHIRHMVGVMGIDHVAIGSDLESGISPPPALRDVARFPELARALRASGYSREDVEKITSKNALRLLCGRARPAASR